MAYKKKEKKIDEIANELKVGTILEGNAALGENELSLNYLETVL